MTLHPEMRAMLDGVKSWREKNGASVDLHDERRKIEVIRAEVWQPELLPVASVRDAQIVGPNTPLDIRIYRPEAENPLPTVIYFHGGGWSQGDLNSHESHARRICNRLGVVVIAVRYRLAPEDIFPAGYNDCVATYDWVLQHIDTVGGDRNLIAVAGDSAGGNLAAAVALYARDNKLPLKAAMYAYSAFDLSQDAQYPSMHAFGTGFGLEVNPHAPEPYKWYLGEDYATPKSDPRVSPLLADQTGVAPAVIYVGECDPLADLSVAYNTKLTAAGVKTIFHLEPGFTHSFMNMGASRAAMKVTTDMIDDLGALLSA
jgi:acetyl esterase